MILGALSSGLNLQRREADHLHPFSTEVKIVGAVLPFPNFFHHIEIEDKKVNLSLCLIKHHAIYTCGEVAV
jgi:hypothetical protein